MAKEIINPAVPNIPLGTEQYSSQFMNQYSNVLRLYFNQLRNALSSLIGNQGGQYLSFPYGAFHQDGTTTLSVAIPNGTSTAAISVASTAGFPSSGWILIGDEIIQYTTKTLTTFDGTITRSVLGTSGSSHGVGDAISEVQGTGSPTTIGTVLFNNTDFSNGVYASNDYSKIYFDIPGIYNIAISVQLLNFTTSEDNVTLWFSQNGTDIPASASIQQVNSKHGSSPGACILALNLYVSVQTSDYIQLKWASDTGDTVVATYPAGTSPVHPASPGLIITAQFVSKLPA